MASWLANNKCTASSQRDRSLNPFPPAIPPLPLPYVEGLRCGAPHHHPCRCTPQPPLLYTRVRGRPGVLPAWGQLPLPPQPHLPPWTQSTPTCYRTKLVLEARGRVERFDLSCQPSKTIRVPGATLSLLITWVASDRQPAAACTGEPKKGCLGCQVPQAALPQQA